MSTTHILLLTGPPGVGKTTIVRRIARGLHPARILGFTTEEMRVGRQRIGFRLDTLDRRATSWRTPTWPRLTVSAGTASTSPPSIG